MASGTTINQMIDVVTPAAGESVTEGTILEWHVKVGDFIKVDDTIVEISTDKVDVELPSPASGTVVEILAEEGDTVGVGQVIARLTSGEGGARLKPPKTQMDRRLGSVPRRAAPRRSPRGHGCLRWRLGWRLPRGSTSRHLPAADREGES